MAAGFSPSPAHPSPQLTIPSSSSTLKYLNRCLWNISITICVYLVRKDIQKGAKWWGACVSNLRICEGARQVSCQLELEGGGVCPRRAVRIFRLPFTVVVTTTSYPTHSFRGPCLQSYKLSACSSYRLLCYAITESSKRATSLPCIEISEKKNGEKVCVRQTSVWELLKFNPPFLPQLSLSSSRRADQWQPITSKSSSRGFKECIFASAPLLSNIS